MKRLLLILCLLSLPLSVFSATDVDIDNNGKIDNSFGGTNTGLMIAQMTVWTPDLINAVEADGIPMLAVESEWAPNGITIVNIGCKTDSAVNGYIMNLEEWNDPSASTSTIDAVTAGASDIEWNDGGSITDPNVATDTIIYVDLDTDDVNYIQIWFTFTINGS